MIYLSKVQEKDIGFEMQCKIVFCTVDIFAVLQRIKLCRILTFVIPEEICDKGKCTHWLNLPCTVGGYRNIPFKFEFLYMLVLPLMGSLIPIALLCASKEAMSEISSRASSVP